MARDSVLPVSSLPPLGMYYDDEARRFNFLSGLVFGTMLGTGLALLVTPHSSGRRRQLRRRPGAWKGLAQDGLGRLREGVLESVMDGVAAGRKYLKD